MLTTIPDVQWERNNARKNADSYLAKNPVSNTISVDPIKKPLQRSGFRTQQAVSQAKPGLERMTNANAVGAGLAFSRAASFLAALNPGVQV